MWQEMLAQTSHFTFVRAAKRWQKGENTKHKFSRHSTFSNLKKHLFMKTAISFPVFYFLPSGLFPSQVVYFPPRAPISFPGSLFPSQSTDFTHVASISFPHENVSISFPDVLRATWKCQTLHSGTLVDISNGHPRFYSGSSIGVISGTRMEKKSEVRPVWY